MLDRALFFVVARAKFCVCPFPRDNRPADATVARWLGDPLTHDAVARCLAVHRDVIGSTRPPSFVSDRVIARRVLQYRKCSDPCGGWRATHTAHPTWGDPGALYPRLKTNSRSPAERPLLEDRHVVFCHRVRTSSAPATAHVGRPASAPSAHDRYCDCHCGHCIAAAPHGARCDGRRRACSTSAGHCRCLPRQPEFSRQAPSGRRGRRLQHKRRPLQVPAPPA